MFLIELIFTVSNLGMCDDLEKLIFNNFYFEKHVMVFKEFIFYNF